LRKSCVYLLWADERKSKYRFQVAYRSASRRELQVAYGGNVEIRGKKAFYGDLSNANVQQSTVSR